MSQAPSDAAPSDTPSQPSVQSTDTSGQEQAAPKKRLSLENAKKALAGFGKKLEELGQKAVDNTKKFVEETEDDIKNTKSMSGLLTMASNEFEEYVKQRSKTTDKVEVLKEIADSFKFCFFSFFCYLSFFLHFFD